MILSLLLFSWHFSQVTSSQSWQPYPLLFSVDDGLQLLCWWVIHITEADAQSPETTFFCCLKGSGRKRLGFDRRVQKTLEEENTASAILRLFIYFFFTTFFFFTLTYIFSSGMPKENNLALTLPWLAKCFWVICLPAQTVLVLGIP